MPLIWISGIFGHKIGQIIFSHPSVKTNCLGAQKNGLTEMVLLSTHSVQFG